MISTIAPTIGQFNVPNIRLLQKIGFDVDVAADFTDENVWSSERINQFKDDMFDINVRCYQVDFSRSPFRMGRHIESYKQIVDLLEENHYEFVHTHTPIASAIVRLAAKKMKTKVIYTAHGFHFYDGAPLKNWIVFYPVEKWLSKYTNVLITINKEDYKRASEKFNAKNVVYIPGVGVDTEKFAPRKSGEERISKELDIHENRILLLSVGELNENKNHESVIKAISGIDNLTYVIVGKGELKEQLQKTALECGVDLRLVGFRADVADFYDAADIYILPSIREGLNVSLMEAMASGLPCLCGNIRGNVDLVDEGKGGYMFNPTSVDEIRNVIQKMLKMSTEDMEKLVFYNLNKIKQFDKSAVNSQMKMVYEKLCEFK